MDDFKFSCPHCGQHLQCNERMAGRQIQCPACHHVIVIPPSPSAQGGGDYAAESGKTWQTYIAPPVTKPDDLQVNAPPKQGGAAQTPS